MKVVLVDNMVLPDDGSLALLDVHPHLGLLALAAVAEADGHTVEIFDPKRLIRWGRLPYDSTLYERAALDLLARRPHVVGFTALGCSFLFAINVAAQLKRREPDLPILLGGPHATMLHRAILERFRQFDIVVRHEADETFPAVLDGLERRSFAAIPGLSWRRTARLRDVHATEGKPKVEDLDALPPVSYDHYPIAELGLDLLRIEAGRGCPFLCTFCSTAGFFQRSFRLKSAERLVGELDRLHARYEYRDFKLDHDMFTVSRRKVMEFCEAVAGRGYRWRASARVDCVDAEMLRKMADAGCVSLYFGIETGSPHLQEICRKRLDLSLVGPILDEADRLGIDTTASFITGYPEEGEADQEQTLDMIGHCRRPTCLAQLHLLAPEPGTPMFEQRGGSIAYDGHAGPYNAKLLAADDQCLVLEHPDIFPTYYHYPAKLPRERYIFAVAAVDLMRRLGPIVLRYLLRARVYEGRLSRLVRDLRLFAERRGASAAAPDAALLEAYCSSTFVPRHHVTSLVRYAAWAGANAAGAAETPADPAAPAYDPAATYLRVTAARALADVHDCGALIERINAHAGAEGLLDDEIAGELGTYVAAGPVSAWVSPGVLAIAELFDEPHTCREVAGELGKALGKPDFDLAIFEQLVRAGLLIAPAVVRRAGETFPS